MLFNSYEFLLLFLPITYLVFLLGKRVLGSHIFVLAWLTTASLFFYGWWNPIYLVLISSSIIFNFSAGRLLAGLEQGHAKRRKLVATVGVVANLAAIGWFKYANFFADSSNSLAGTDIQLAPIILPLAISFFTFQQIAYLIDVYRNPTESEPDFLHYAFFVCFFPQLIAGPIVHHSEIMPQLRGDVFRKLPATLFAEGVSFFMVGLFKKVALADTFAVLANPVFDAAAQGVPISFVEAWIGAIAYTLQLYFDFSGYSDMAIGLGMMFGLRLPLNFNSPYKALSITDFWRRWHMTLSRFLRDYVYIPLGGNRLGPSRRYTNLLATMLIGGLWHGAGWTFVFWGGLHGLYLAINHAWNSLAKQLGWNFAAGHARPADTGAGIQLYKLCSGGLTFFAVIVAWVFFRATSFDAATNMLQGMLGMQAMVLPPSYADMLAALPAVGQLFSWQSGELELLEWTLLRSLILLMMGLAIVWLLPNTQELFSRAKLMLADELPARWWYWKQSVAWSICIGILTAFSLSFVAGESEFLYFQF